MQAARLFLSDFAFTEWPDLTAERNPSPRLYSITTPLILPPNAKDVSAALLASIGRVLGTYCAASDILLASRAESGQRYTLIRVSWTNEQTWGQIVHAIALQLQAGPDHHFLVAELRRALDLQEKQFPCLASLSSHPPTDSSSASDFPFTIIHDSDGQSLHLASSTANIHPSVSEQLLAQIGLVLEYSLNNPHSTISTLPCFPPHLLSIYSRASDDDIASIYPHLPKVQFATDYLRARATSTPDAIAVRWFPDLLGEDPFCSSESITYLELDQKASQFARWLIRQGLKQEDRVAVCLSRDLLFHVALMGIMRAGGCYVPVRTLLFKTVGFG